MGRKGIIHITSLIFVIAIVVFVGLLFTSLTNNSIKRYQSLNTGSVLSEKSAISGFGGGSSKSEDTNSSLSNTSSFDLNLQEGSTADDQNNFENELEDLNEVELEDEESLKDTDEIDVLEKEIVKFNSEPEKTRIDVAQNGIKVRYEIKKNKVLIKAETEEGDEIPEQEIVKIVDRLDKSGIKISTAGGQILITKNNIGALSSFPLQIDLATNQLIASTSAGAKVLTILPDQAVQNMLATNIINKLNPNNQTTAIIDGQTSIVEEVIQLGLQNDIPIYEIKGLRNFNLLGFISITLPISATISATDGQILSTQQSPISRLIDLLSP